MTPAPETRIAANALNQLGSNVFALIAGAVASIVLARVLGPTEMGSYVLVLVIVAALKAATGFGLSRTTLKFSAELIGQAEAPRAVWWLLVRRAALALLAAIALAVAAPWLGLLFQDPRLPMLLVLGAGVLFVEQVASVLESALEGVSRFDLLARLKMGLLPLSVGVTVAAVALGSGTRGVLGIHLAFSVATLILLAALGRRAGVFAWAPGKPEPQVAARMARFARQGYWLSMLTFVVHDRSEVLLIGALSSAQEVAFYSVALRAAGALMSLGPWIVATIFFPLLAADWARGDRRALSTHYAQYVRYLALAAAPLALGGLVAADIAVALLYGPAYAPMVPVIRVTLLAVAVAALADAPTAILAAAERQDWLLRVQGPLAIANVLLDIALIPNYGALGAGLATLAVSVASAMLLGALAWRLSGAALPVTLVIPFLAAAGSAAMVALTLGALPDALGLGISLVAAPPIYLGILALLRFFRADDAEVVAPLLGRLPLLFRPGRRSWFGDILP